jgi:hypothetical protein
MPLGPGLPKGDLDRRRLGGNSVSARAWGKEFSVVVLLAFGLCPPHVSPVRGP